MSIVEPPPDEPRRPQGPRDPGDAWVVAEDGTKYWGRYGAAGLLAVDDERGVLLQQRVGWSHFGGTWGIPGGALHQGEASAVGAMRESQEEAGVPDGSVHPLFTSVYDIGIWSYTTLIAVVEHPFEPVIADPESLALEWVPVAEVDQRELHPGFAASWPALREALAVRPVVVVDGANVVGSTPNGWWKDRAGAAARLLESLAEVARDGISADALGLAGTTWFPRIVAVLEGQAKAAGDLAGGGGAGAAGGGAGAGAGGGGAGAGAGVEVVRANGSGDDEIVAVVAREISRPGAAVHVVTSDRELRGRVEALGALTHGARWLSDR